MRLRKGIQILLPKDESNNNARISLSSGTEPASVSNSFGFKYGKNAFLPKGPWRSPDAQELQLLLREDPCDEISSCLGIIKIPDAVFNPILDLGIGKVGSLHEFKAASQSKGFKEIEAALVNYVTGFRIADKEIQVFAPTLGPPGLPTATFDHGNLVYLGMHLDSWDKMPLDVRHQASNRISINIGLEDRFFLFVNLPMAVVLKMLPKDHSNSQNMVSNFLAANSEYPIVKVRVRPGEAYIAPTENIIHDGCTLERKSPDIHVTVRGFFRVDHFPQ